MSSNRNIRKHMNAPNRAFAKASKSSKKINRRPEIQDGAADVEAWIDGVKPEHRTLVKRIDTIIGEMIPGVRRAIKWRKPSQPLGIPFYGSPERGWMVAMWSFKDRVGVGFFAGTLLRPEPPVTTMAGPWNAGTTVKARRIDIADESAFDEVQLRSWLAQAHKVTGWAKGCSDLS